jgi:hypothetical protein
VEVYVLDSLLRRTEVVDRYESLIWTERYSRKGDFELHLKSTSENRGLFTKGTMLAITDSDRVMTVETAEDSTDADGKEIFKVIGYSIEDVLARRIVKSTMDDLTTDPSWTIIDTPGNVVRTMFDHICRDGALDVKDKIPFLMPGTIYPPDTIEEPSSPITWVQQPDTLENALQGVVDLYDLGFRLVRNKDTSELYFDVYSGNDRTTRQTTFSPVIFAPDFDTLQNTTEYTSIQDSKNVAYVFSNRGSLVVYGEKVPPDIDGFDRRVLVVTLEIDDAEPDPNGIMLQAGQEGLRANRAQELFDGEVNQYNTYKYGKDYNLGDLVEQRNRDGIITFKRVTEQIFVSDDQGDRSYPTLYMPLYVGENDWLSWASKGTTWADLDADPTTWADED